MKTETKKLLADVVAACCSIGEFTSRQSFEDYAASDLLRSAVERKFAIVGEALVRLRETDRDAFDSVKDAAAVAGL